ncbi:MAG: hypothetical protein OWV35_04330 [Firmicutes bacterium]|nr:hypothetical protein [Bacillota bacterium]
MRFRESTGSRLREVPVELGWAGQGLSRYWARQQGLVLGLARDGTVSLGLTRTRGDRVLVVSRELH